MCIFFSDSIWVVIKGFFSIFSFFYNEGEDEEDECLKLVGGEVNQFDFMRTDALDENELQFKLCCFQIGLHTFLFYFQ